MNFAVTFLGCGKATGSCFLKVFENQSRMATSANKIWGDSKGDSKIHFFSPLSCL